MQFLKLLLKIYNKGLVVFKAFEHRILISYTIKHKHTAEEKFTGKQRQSILRCNPCGTETIPHAGLKIY